MTTTISNSPALVGSTINVTANHEGLNAVPFNWTAAGHTLSTGVFVYLAKIPHGATITNIQMVGWVGAQDGATLDVGLTGEASADFLIDGAAVSSTATLDVAYGTGVNKIRAGALPHFVSLSDDTQPRFRYLQAKFATIATATNTAMIRGVVEYVMGRPNLGN